MNTIRKITATITSEWRGLYPSRALLFSVGGGSFSGLVLFLVHISNFFSYFSDNPATCMNCHIMGPQYATWAHSAHREAATCNDCHVPQDNLFKKNAFKALDGMRHSAIFTMRAEPQVITIKSMGEYAVQGNCQRCHAGLFEHPTREYKSFFNSREPDTKRCWDCHTHTPHGDVRSLSSAPLARVPTTGSMIPEWLERIVAEQRRKRDEQGESRI